MADRYDDRLRNDRYRDERGYDRTDRGFTARAGDEVRSWFGDEEAERRRRLDEQERRERDRRREYGRGYEPEWGDYPYRGETWHVPETARGVESGRRDYGPYPGEAGARKYGHGTETFRPHGREYRPGWESGVREDFTGRGPKSYQRSDARIYEDVCDRLAEAPDIDASDIEVRTTNGEVTLLGTVREREEKRRVEDVIEGVSGVRDIHNNLRVGKPRDEQPRASSI
jgi:osmotically-inducible protein OsmY